MFKMCACQVKHLRSLSSKRILLANFLKCKSKSYATDATAKKTCLYDFHVAKGGKMVPFAGWMMPVHYLEGIVDSHLHVRNAVGLFDVSHMLQTKIYGKDRMKFIESLVVSDVTDLAENQGCLTVFTNDKGGINDDLIVMNASNKFLFVVSNAGCSDKDLSMLKDSAADFRSKNLDVDVEVVPNGLLALQGPSMVKALQPGLDFHISEVPFMRTVVTSLYGIPGCRVTRCGYTGEDGVEISVDADKTEQLVCALLDCKTADVHMIGLGARDSLRLEAGLCLYGNDIDETTTPVEAALVWTIGKRRREVGDFPGADVILKQLRDKPSRRRVGVVSSGAPARGGTVVYDESGSQEIGKITSGCPSPTLCHNVAMGYLNRGHTKAGSKVKLLVRKKMIDAEVTRMPFVKLNYYK